jgi:hypothetical protein
MARKFGGDARRMRAESARSMALNLNVNTSPWSVLEKASFENFAVALAPVHYLSSWTREEKDVLSQIIRAKAARNEMKFLHLTQKHERLRDALLKMGS